MQGVTQRLDFKSHIFPSQFLISLFACRRMARTDDIQGIVFTMQRQHTDQVLTLFHFQDCFYYAQKLWPPEYRVSVTCGRPVNCTRFIAEDWNSNIKQIKIDPLPNASFIAHLSFQPLQSYLVATSHLSRHQPSSTRQRFLSDKGI